MKRFIISLILLCLIQLNVNAWKESKKVKLDGVYYVEITTQPTPNDPITVYYEVSKSFEEPYSGDIILHDSFNGNKVSFQATVFPYTSITSVFIEGTFKFRNTGFNFSHCPDLKSVSMPDMETTYNKYAFSDCKQLRTVKAPNLKEIVSYSFMNCEQLETIETPNLKEFASFSFMNCKSLKEFTLPLNMEKFEASAFVGCENLGKFILSPDETRLAFQDNMLLKYGYSLMCHLYNDKTDSYTFTIPNSIRRIDSSYAFLADPYLKKVIFPERFEAIDGFQDCKSLEYVDFPQVATYISGFTNCISLTDLKLPDAKNIEKDAFSNCSKLQKIEFSSLDRINEDAFNNCTSLDSIKFSSKLEYLNGFSNCTSLESLVLPYVRFIGPKAFNGCSKLKRLESYGWSTYDEDAFHNSPISEIVMRCSEPPYLPPKINYPIPYIKNVTVYVPKGSLEKYKNHSGWYYYINIIEGDYAGVDVITDDGGIAVVATGDGIEVSGADEEAVAEVYTVSGQLVYRGTERQIPVSKGIYIVRIAGKALKVAVK